MKRHIAMVMTVLSVGLTTGCVGGGENVDRVGQHEIWEGYLYWRSLTFTFSNGKSFATVYLFKSPVGNFAVGKEYWYVNLDSLTYLGSKSLSVTTYDSPNPAAPSDPNYANQQSFILTQTSNWGSSWTSDPLSGGNLYTASNGQALRITQGTSPARLTSLAWYQVLPINSTPSNITPASTFDVGGSSVAVPSGNVGYDILEAVP